MSTNRFNKIFATTCDQYNLGTAFLIWSIHYLIDQQQFYSLKTGKNELVPNNPLLNGTAHKMRPNRYRFSLNLKDILDKVSTSNYINHIRFFPDTKNLDQYAVENIKFQRDIEKYGIKVLNITSNKLQTLLPFLRAHYEDLNWQNNFEAVKKHCVHYWPNFFSNLEIFPSKLNNWHDIRENIAFHIRPFENKILNNTTHKNPTNVLIIQFQDFLFDGRQEILKIFDFLKFEYKKEKIKNWSTIHKKWSKNLKNYVLFCNDLELIVSNIIKNKKMDLKKYKINILKEAVILHLLMFKYNYNFKTNSDRLPNCTSEIYKLLIKNNRTGIEKIYDNQ